MLAPATVPMEVIPVLSIESFLHAIDYQEHFFNTISCQYIEGDVERWFMFCECATEREKNFTCDGQQKAEENNCCDLNR